MAIQVNQCEYASLVALGYLGSINKMRRDWEKDNTIITSTDFYKKLIEAGYTGAFPDMERDFWCEGGGSFNSIRGWTDGLNCTGGGLNEVLLQFPGEVSFTGQIGIGVYTSDDGGATPIKMLTIPEPPAQPTPDTVNYGSDWSESLVSTDLVYWKAEIGNTYLIDGVSLEPTQIKLNNCLPISVDSWILEVGIGDWLLEDGSGNWGLE